MIWSKYNFVFRSEEFGGLLYNALTNSFLTIPDAVYDSIASLKPGDEYQGNDLGIFIQLAAAKALVEPGEDAGLSSMIRMQRRALDYSNRILSLTIVPTLACNCACPYCFEKHQAIHMSEETEDELVRFAERFAPGKCLSVGWFGGEPLLRFEQICRLTEKLQKLDFKKYHADIITNGTLLTEKVIPRLNDLAIHAIQITIDGPREIHDARRMLASGGGTFDCILQNIDHLLSSDWKGKIALRVNVDKDNRDRYQELYHFLNTRYSAYQDRLHIYSGITTYTAGDRGTNPDLGCGMNIDETAEFILKEAKGNGAKTQPLYPTLSGNGCMATHKNSFVIGPEGEVYKCLQCVGNREERVGSILPEKPWNNIRLSQYMEEANPLNDPACLDCNLFPICNGGCIWKRMRGEEHCSCFKKHLPQLLEAHYRTRKEKNGASKNQR